MAFKSLTGAEWTYPPRDWVPVDAESADVDLRETLGYTPRAVRANADGVLNYRLVDSDEDRSDDVLKGEIIPGFFTDLLTGCTCDPRVAK